MIRTGYFSGKLGSGGLETGNDAVRKPSQNQLPMLTLTGPGPKASYVECCPLRDWD